jgi:hypothetical protein
MTIKTINERTSGEYTATLVDPKGDHPGLLSLTLSLIDLETEEFINGREAQSVLNENNGSYDSLTGIFTWLIQPADNMIIGDGDEEIHRAIFSGVWVTGRVIWQQDIKVVNIKTIV